MYKKVSTQSQFAYGMDTVLSVASMGLAASGVGHLSTFVAAPVAIGIRAGAIVCGFLGAGSKFIGLRFKRKLKKHDQIRVLAESKLDKIADRISAALTDDESSDKMFCLILSEVEKFDQMKAEILWRQGLSEDEKKARKASERGGNDYSPFKQLEEFHQAGKLVPLSKHFVLASFKERRLVRAATKCQRAPDHQVCRGLGRHPCLPGTLMSRDRAKWRQVSGLSFLRVREPPGR